MVAALVLSTGGVAYRIKADPQPNASRVAPGAPAAQAEQLDDAGSCPAEGRAASKPVVIQIEQIPPAKEFISLNSSGYNYSDPRRVPAVAPPQTSPEGGSPEPAAAEDQD